MGNYKSVESRKGCTARGCSRYGFDKQIISSKQKISNVSKQELEKFIEKAIESEKCPACKKTVKDLDYRSYSPLLFLQVNARSNSKIRLYDFARKINCFKTEFQLLFIIDNSNDKCVSFFAHKYDEEERKITFMKLSDCPPSEAIIKKDQIVQPSLICFVKSTIKRKHENLEKTSEPVAKRLKIQKSIQQEPTIEPSTKQNHQLSSSHFIFSNTINKCVFDQETNSFYDVQALCTFNGFLHGMIASYLHYENFSNYIQEKKNSVKYFMIIDELIQLQRQEERSQKWIDYLYNEFDSLKSWKCLDKNGRLLHYSMYYKIDDMIQTLLADHSTFISNYACSCSYMREVKSPFMSLNISNNNSQQDLMEQLANGIKKHLAYNKKSCSTCKKQITPTVTLNPLLIIQLRFATRRNREISLNNLLLNQLKTSDGLYRPLFFIKFDENMRHFTCFFNNHGTVIEIDDLPPQANIIDDKNIKILADTIIFFHE